MKKKTQKRIYKNEQIIGSPYLEPYIFKNIFKNYILNNKNTQIKLDFNELCKIFYNSSEAKYYQQLSTSLLKNNINNDENLLLYMNFKSHNILNKTSREKLYYNIKEYNPNIICLSEALLPISLINNKSRNNNNIKITNLNSIKDDTIISPYKGAKQFEKKKKDTVGILKDKNIWKKFFIDNGYNYILFANPTECPWGHNWGNCIITKTKPDFYDVLQMKSYGKTAFEEPESRNMVVIKMGNEYICTTHLDNNNVISRTNQTKEIIKYIKNIKKMGIKNKITLMGDFNAINRDSYTKEELQILRELNINKNELPFDSIDMINKSNILGKKPINTGQKYESLFQKCVTHVYSSKYKNNVMILTDATDMDHQPLFIW